MRVLICRSNPIDPDPRVEKMAGALASCGYSVTLLGWDRSAQLPSRAEANLQGNAIRIYRLPLKAAFGHGLANLPNLLRWQWRLFGWLRRHRGEFEVVHACDFDTILPALDVQMVVGKKGDLRYLRFLRRPPASHPELNQTNDPRSGFKGDWLGGWINPGR